MVVRASGRVKGGLVIAFVFLEDHVATGFAVASVAIVMHQPAVRAGALDFAAAIVEQDTHELSGLPWDKDDGTQDHENDRDLSSSCDGHEVAEAHGGHCGDSKVERVAEGVNSAIGDALGAFDKVDHPRRDEHKHENGEDHSHNLQVHVSDDSPCKFFRPQQARKA